MQLCSILKEDEEESRAILNMMGGGTGKEAVDKSNESCSLTDLDAHHSIRDLSKVFYTSSRAIVHGLA